jgi:hypothetical protein
LPSYDRPCIVSSAAFWVDGTTFTFGWPAAVASVFVEVWQSGGFDVAVSGGVVG